MPNHITNLISFGDQPEQVAAFHQMLRDLRQKDGVYGSIDFNKLIPMPKALDIESGTRTTNGLDAYRRFITGDKAGAEAFQKEHPEEWALGKQAYENIQQYGSPTWYEWCNKNWGTKWNAYSCVELGKDDDTLEFFTAWSSVPTILEALSRKYPDQTIRLHQKVRRWPRELSESLGKWTQILPAQRWLLKRTRLFVARNVVSPMRSFAKEAEVSTPQGEETAQRVEERDKKRRPAL